MDATVADAVITRQRSGTAKWLIVPTQENETGNVKVIIAVLLLHPRIYPRFLLTQGSGSDRYDIAKCCIPLQPALVHPGQHRNQVIHVIVNLDESLLLMETI